MGRVLTIDDLCHHKVCVIEWCYLRKKVWETVYRLLSTVIMLVSCVPCFLSLQGIVSMGYASRIIDVLACWKGWFTRRGFGDAWCAVPLCLMWLSWKKCNCKAFEVDMEVDDGNGRLETSAAGEQSTCDVDTNQEPYVGMDFESEEAARAFYNKYAKQEGFLTRVLSSRKSERDRSIISRGLGCRGGSVNRKQDGQREVCTAMILLKREKSGRWVVRKFVRDHNHPLVVQLQKSRQIIDEKDRKIQELTAELRVKKRLSSAYREQLLKLMKDVEDHNEHLRTKVELVFDNLREFEAKRKEVSDRK
ncbi:protein FAR1-RELATED SEQUENCE 5 isoform X1 [Quercus suber]|uniref:protein FAR1-RELATED SEQUENCE 5 isoform X1 n=1 Tax=Quercus suber TaxID=58331 RepID=UPI0032DFF71A